MDEAVAIVAVEVLEAERGGGGGGIMRGNEGVGFGRAGNAGGTLPDGASVDAFSSKLDELPAASRAFLLEMLPLLSHLGLDALTGGSTLAGS